MSKRKILAALMKKNIEPTGIEYVRGCPVPEGYADGWELEFSEELEDQVYDLNPKCEFETFKEFDSLKEVLEWINTLPDLAKDAA